METANHEAPVRNFYASNYIATDPLPRDQTQSLRLHEPSQMLTCIDPITGRDI